MEIVFIHVPMREMDYWGKEMPRLTYSRLNKNLYQPTATAASTVKTGS